MTADLTNIDPDVRAALQRLRLLKPGEAATFTPLTGGVSSDIWKVETARQTFAVKRALAKLKVAQDWRAPVERSQHEYDWIETARAIVPSIAPDRDALLRSRRLQALEIGAARRSH
jgi:hypothetical protein